MYSIQAIKDIRVSLFLHLAQEYSCSSKIHSHASQQLQCEEQTPKVYNTSNQKLYHFSFGLPFRDGLLLRQTGRVKKRRGRREKRRRGEWNQTTSWKLIDIYETSSVPFLLFRSISANKKEGRGKKKTIYLFIYCTICNNRYDDNDDDESDDEDEEDENIKTPKTT